MNVLEMLTASAVLQTSLVLAVGVTAVDHPPVAHEHAVEVGPQDRCATSSNPRPAQMA